MNLIRESSQKNTQQDGFRSRKLLNFNFSARDHLEEFATPNAQNFAYNSNVNLKDVIGNNGYMLSPMSVTKSTMKNRNSSGLGHQ